MHKKHRFPWIRSTVATTALAALTAQVFGETPAPRPPNILFVMPDDHGVTAISAYGDDRIQTPNIDRLAGEGMRFDRAYVANSICGPSRATILTGKHSHANGYWRNNAGFDATQNTFPKLIADAGYQTAVIGKWHLDVDPVMFDHFDVLIDQGVYYNPPMRTNRGGEAHTVPHIGHSTKIITDKVLAWLRHDRDPERPFVMLYQTKAPHRPWQPALDTLDHFDGVDLPEPATLFEDFSGRGPASKIQTMSIARDLIPASDLKLRPPGNLLPDQLRTWNAHYQPLNDAFEQAGLEGDDLVRWKYQRYAKDYLRCIKAVDDQLGRVLEYLDASGLAENTIVIYTSDNGWYLGEFGWYDKRWMYELSLRVPLIVRWPGHIEPGTTSDRIVSNLDFASTFLDLAGLASPDDVHGHSIVPLLKGKEPDDWRESFYYHYMEGRYSWHGVPRHYGVTTGSQKLIHFYELGDEWEFYDLKTDPKELTNQYANPAYATAVTDMKRELARLREHYQVPGEDPVSFEEARRMQKSGPAQLRQ